MSVGEELCSGRDIMEHEVHWHMSAFAELLRLRLPSEASLAEVVAEIERWAKGLAGWADRDADRVGDLEYFWVFPQAKFFSVLLPDGRKWGFADLRLFCLAWDAEPRVCILAVDANGRERIAKDFFGLLTRVEDAHFLHGEEEP
jgi:hypothetical protein